jgi:hypothetical protein
MPSITATPGRVASVTQDAIDKSEQVPPPETDVQRS